MMLKFYKAGGRHVRASEINQTIMNSDRLAGLSECRHWG